MAKWLDILLFRRRRKQQEPESAEGDYIDVEPVSPAPRGRSPDRSGTWLAKLRPSYRREQQIGVLQEGFEELVGLTRTIREHMDQQVQTQKTLVDLMKNLPEAVDGLKSVGKATEQQTETLALLKKQMESNVQHGEQMIDSIKHFNQTLGRMDETSKSTASTVAALVEKGRESEDLLRQILERSEKRLIYLIGTLLVVTLLVLGAGLYLGLADRLTVDRTPEPAIAPLDWDTSITTIPRDADLPGVTMPEQDLPDEILEPHIHDVEAEPETEESDAESPGDEGPPEDSDETDEPDRNASAD